MPLILGIIFGIFLTVFSELYLIYYIYNYLINLKNNKKDNNKCENNNDKVTDKEINEKKEIKKESDSDIDKEAWPPKIVEYLENCLFPQYNEKSNSATESCTWLNILFARYFLELRKAKEFKERMKKKLNDKFTRKLKNNSYIQNVEITDIDLGDVTPHFNGIRVKKSSSEKLEVNLEIEMEYSGAPNSLSFKLDIKLVKGIIIPVKIKLLKCNGTLLIVVPYLKNPTLFGVTFVNNPNPEFSIEILSNKYKDKKKYIFTFIFSVINRLLKSLFLEYWTLPAIRTIDLPLVAPKIPIYVYVSNDNNPNNNIPQPIQSTKRHTNSQKSLDIILDKTFPIYEHVSSTNASLFNERLTSTFVYLAKENNNDIYNLIDQRQIVNQSPLAYEFWKTIKNKHGIHIQKKQINEYGERGCIFKGTFAVGMNPKSVYNIITNMSNEANGYVFSDTFIRSSVIKRFNNDTLVRHLLFKFNRQQNHGYIVFEAHKEIEDDDDISNTAFSIDKPIILNEEEEENKQNKYVIVWRSIAGVKNDEIDEISLKKENSGLNNGNLNKKTIRRNTVDNIIDLTEREKFVNILNKQNNGIDQKTAILTANKNDSLAISNSFLKPEHIESKKEKLLSRSFHSFNSLSFLSKNETEPIVDLLQKPMQLTDKMTQSPTMNPREIALKKDNSSKNLSTDDKTNNNYISEMIKRRKKESLKIEKTSLNIENSEDEHYETLDQMISSTGDDTLLMENTKPFGMFNISDDEEVIPNENYLNLNRTDSSTSSLVSLSEKYEDTSSVVLDNDHYLSMRKNTEKIDFELSDNEKTIETSILELKSLNSNERKSILQKSSSKDTNLNNIINNTNNNKSEFFENINTLFIKGFYLEPQLGDPESCYLTVISQYEPSFKKFEANYEYCRKLKKYLEDQNHIINGGSNASSIEDDKKKPFGRSLSSENIAKLGKIKNYFSSSLVKVKRSHNNIKESNKPQPLKHDFICASKLKLESSSNIKLKQEIVNNNNNSNSNNSSNNSIVNNNNNSNDSNVNNVNNTDNSKTNNNSNNSNSNSVDNNINNINAKIKSELSNVSKLTDDISGINISNTVNSNKLRSEEIIILNNHNNEIVNGINESINNNVVSSKSSHNDDELTKSIPVPPTSSMPNTTATLINNQNPSIINNATNINTTINTTSNNTNSNKKGVIKILKKVQKVVKRGNSNFGDDHNSPKLEDSSNMNSSLYLNEIHHSTDSINSLDEEKEKEVHTKNNIVILKHVNKPNIPLNKQNFTNQFINNKETIRVESQHLGGEIWNELRFEFNEAKNLPLDFGILFKPSNLSTFDKWRHIYSESSNEPGVFVIVPTYTCYTSQTLKIINGCISVYNFPPGIFICKWDNNARKTPKHISFRLAIQPVTLLCNPQNSLSQYCNEYNSVVSIKQRSCGKFSINYIPLNEHCYNSIGISGRTAFLNYQIYTKGSDIQFGIIYESLQEDFTHLQEVQSTQTLDVSNVRRVSNLSRKASSLTNIINNEQYNNDSLTNDEKLKLSYEGIGGSPKMEKNDIEKQFINEIHQVSTNTTKDSFELKPNQRFIIPISKCNSNKNEVNGTIPISNKFGIYKFIFNNSNSKIKSKKLELKIKLLIL